jgi:tetratricopeptide (TPR) repeat protein
MMNTDRERVNLVLAALMIGLGAWTIYYLASDRSQPPVIQPRDASGLPANHPPLPENHPPIDYAKDLLALEQMSRSDPENPEYKTKIGNLYYDAGDYEKAAEAYRQSLELKPQNARVETDLAACLHYLGNHDKALELLDHVLQYAPSFAQALFNKGVVLHSGKKDVNGAIAVWEQLLRSNPDLPQRAALEQRINQLKSGSR